MVEAQGPVGGNNRPQDWICAHDFLGHGRDAHPFPLTHDSGCGPSHHHREEDQEPVKGGGERVDRSMPSMWRHCSPVAVDQVMDLLRRLPCVRWNHVTHYGSPVSLSFCYVGADATGC